MMLRSSLLLRSLPSLLVAMLAGGCGAEFPVPDRVVLVTIDTLRADHVGFGGYPLPITPFLDSLAEQGTVFDRTLAQAPTTGPSHASIFTGLYPIQHRVQANGQKLDPVFLTLAEAFAAADFQTAAFVSTNAHFKWGDLSQGFEVYDEQPLRSPDGTKIRRKDYRGAGETIEAAIDWLADRDPSERLFLWVHLYDPHLPFQPPPDHLTAVQRMSKELGVEVHRAHLRAAHGDPDRQRMFQDIQSYDAEILYVDRELERLYRSMSGPDSNDLWIVTSDHGQGLNSHDGWMGHAWQIYEVQMRVPLIFHFTGDPSRSRVIDNVLVEHVDLAPTLAELMNLDFEQTLGRVQGTSLVPWLGSAEGTGAKGYSLGQNSWYHQWKENRANQSLPKLSLRTMDSKYIQNEGEADELYDLQSDPNERVNLIDAPEHSAERERLQGALQRLVESLENLEIDPESVDDETLERLRALGYLQ